MRSKHVFMLLSRISLVFGGLALLVLLGTQAVRTSAATPAYIRVIHASPAVGTADVFVDGNLLLSSFAFGAVGLCSSSSRPAQGANCAGRQGHRRCCYHTNAGRATWGSLYGGGHRVTGNRPLY